MTGLDRYLDGFSAGLGLIGARVWRALATLAAERGVVRDFERIVPVFTSVATEECRAIIADVVIHGEPEQDFTHATGYGDGIRHGFRVLASSRLLLAPEEFERASDACADLKELANDE